MDAAIAQIISGFGPGISVYEGNLGTDHPLILEAKTLLSEMEEIGEGAGDIGGFMAQAQDKMTRLGQLMGELATAKPQEKAEPGNGSRATDPVVAQMVSAYRAGFNALDRSDPFNAGQVACYERIFDLASQAENALHFQRLLVESGVLIEMPRDQQIATSKKTLEMYREKKLSAPVMKTHYRLLDEAMTEVKSGAEIEFAANLLVEYNAAEQQWDGIIQHYMTKAIDETVGLLMDPSEEQQKNVENATRFVAEFFGIGWDEMFAVPRVWDYWQMVFEASKSTWQQDRNCETPEQARDFITAMNTAVMKDRAPVEVGPAANQTGFLFWGETVSLDHLMDAYDKPPRPKVAD